jgi:2-C-methyl-D-erythritol 4-phosphate cytidylyltransferase
LSIIDVNSEADKDRGGHMVRNIMVVLAGGVGSRMAMQVPKQMLKVAGKTLLEHTMDVMQSCKSVDEVIVVMNERVKKTAEGLLDRVHYSKLTGIISGGETRNDSTMAAIAAINWPDDSKVLFHDAVRPFVDNRIIDDCYLALDEYDAVDTAIESADTLITVDEDGCISSIPDRSHMRRGQTPQGFRLGTLKKAYAAAVLDPNFHATDDCGVVFKYVPEVRIRVVSGTAENMKVTEPIDLHIADKQFQLRSDVASSDLSGELDLSDRVVVVFGGSYGIGHSVVEKARELGASVYSFSRSTTGTDVTKYKNVKQALAMVYEHEKRVDAVVLTAGVLRVGSLTNQRRRTIRETVETNLTAAAHVARASFKYLKRSKGKLLLYTSSSYTRGRQDYGVYSATKAGVVNLTQALGEEWMDYGVSINCVNPQRTNTPKVLSWMRIRSLR